MDFPIFRLEFDLCACRNANRQSIMFVSYSFQFVPRIDDHFFSGQIGCDVRERESVRVRNRLKV